MPIGSSKLGVLGAGLVPGGSVTFNTSGNWSVPPGVKKVSITGKGATGNPGNPGNPGNAGTNGIGGGGGSGGLGAATNVALGGYGGGIYTTFGPGNWTAVRGGLQVLNPGPAPVAGGPGPAGPAGSSGSGGSAGSAGNPGQASSGLGNTFPGGAGGNAGNAGNAGTGGGAGPGGTAGNGRGNSTAGNGGAGGTGGGAGSPGGTVRPGPPCSFPGPAIPQFCNTLGGGGGGGAGATNDGQPGKDSNNIPRAIYQQQVGQGPPSIRGGMGGTTSGFCVSVYSAANPGFNIPCAGSSTSGGMGGGFGNCTFTNCGGRIIYYPGMYALGGRVCASRQPIQGAGGLTEAGAGLCTQAAYRARENGPNPTPSRQPQYPMQNLGLSGNNNVVRSGGGGGSGVGSSPGTKPCGAGGGGGGGGRGGAGNAGGAGGAGGTGATGTPQTFNCVPVTPGATTPIVVASPGGQVVISWNPQ